MRAQLKLASSSGFNGRILIGHFFFVVIFLTSCASHPKYGWTEDEGVPRDGVDPSAMSASNMSVRKRIPTHEQNRVEFYFKHCDLDSSSAVTSKTSYFCNQP